ncbi:MAG: ABC transporter permease [Candidatus Tectomicrobia bacterium]|nr:ABC transporter permease [Candidatus Tectomicrobia bacterium]
MNVWIALRVALRSLSKNTLRTALTALGVIIGVGAVIAMVSIGEGAKVSVQASIDRLGTNVIMAFAGSTMRGGAHGGVGSTSTLTDEDAAAIARECPAVQYVSPGVRRPAQVVYGNRNWSTNVNGNGHAYQYIRDWPMARGSFYTQRHEATAAKVAVVGATVVKNLFPDVDPVGVTLRISNIPFRVIGVLSEKGSNAFGQDQDDVVMIPYTTAQKRLMGITNISAILVSAKSSGQVQEAVRQITSVLRRRHRLQPGAPNDFFVRTQLEFSETASESNRIMTLLLGSIAAISLLVGGIGIMNIMLVSVTERTREIGIRMAVGAKRGDILLQFLIEAVVLSLLGGIIGVATGIATAKVITWLAGWPTLVGVQAILLAFGFAVLIGLFFGYYPARAASALNPIDALRYE